MIQIDKRIEHYNKWLKRESMERPMIGLAWEPDISPLPEMLEQFSMGKSVSPDQIQPEMVLDWIEHCYGEAAQLQSDVIQGFAPAFGVPWIEAIAGCPVVANQDHCGPIRALIAIRVASGSPLILTIPGC